MSTPSTVRSALVGLGVLLLVGGLVCVVLGFSRFASTDPMDDGGATSALGLFAGGGLAMVVGLGVVGFTRVSAMARDGRYTRVTIEQGQHPTDGPVGPA